MTRTAPIALAIFAAALAGCLPEQGGFGFHHLDPEHCRIPLAHSLPTGDADELQFWLPGPHRVASTVEWPDCPPLDESTADGDAPRITYPTDGAGGVAPGRWPIVVFGHANSVSVCNPTDRYRTLHEQWASWGWVTYSVDASEQNCKKWTREAMDTRVDKFDLAVEELRRRNGDPRSQFHGHLDFERVIAVGHSRGGAAAVSLASRGPHWSGSINLQGGNPQRFGLGDAFTDLPAIGITTGLDKDLHFPHVDLTEDLLVGRYSWHDVRRGNHTFTSDGLPIRNTDIPEEILPRAVQLDLMKYLTTTFLAANFGVSDGASLDRVPDAEPILYDHFGDEFARGFLRGSGFVSRWSLGPEHDAIWIDRFNSRAVYRGADTDPDSTRLDPATNELGLANTCSGLTRCEEVWTYEPDSEDTPSVGYRLPSSLLLVAGDSSGTWTTEVERDVGDDWRLQARVRERSGITAEFDVIIHSPDGAQRVRGANTVSTAGLSDRFEQVDVRLDTTRVDAVTFELHRGELFIDDLRLVAPR